MIELTESTSKPTTAPASSPDTPTCSVFFAIFAHLALWGPLMVVILGLLITQKIPLLSEVSPILGVMLSSLPLFAIAAHLRQQAVTNHLLEKIANKK